MRRFLFPIFIANAQTPPENYLKNLLRQDAHNAQIVKMGTMVKNLRMSR